MRKFRLAGVGVGLVALLAVATPAVAQDPGLVMDRSTIHTAWVVLAAGFVLLMQAVFAFLEMGLQGASSAVTLPLASMKDPSLAVVAFWLASVALVLGAIRSSAGSRPSGRGETSAARLSASREQSSPN